MKYAVSALALVAAAALIVTWMQTPKPYRATELTNLYIKNHTIHFEVDPNSRFFPLLIKTQKEEGQLQVTIYKQMKLSPIKGILYTPPAGEVLLNIQNPLTTIDAEIDTLGSTDPNVVLRSHDGDLPIPTRK